MYELLGQGGVQMQCGYILPSHGHVAPCPGVDKRRVLKTESVQKVDGSIWGKDGRALESDFLGSNSFINFLILVSTIF